MALRPSVLALFASLCLLAAPSALAGSSSGTSGSGTTAYSAFMTKTLTATVNTKPTALYRVIVKGKKGYTTATIAGAQTAAMTTDPATGSMVRKQYAVINGTASTLSGKQIQKLAKNAHVSAITGYTADGFSKPELGAPGRYLNGATPTAGAMYTQHPERVVANGYMWMSGTSFAAPVVVARPRTSSHRIRTGRPTRSRVR